LGQAFRERPFNFVVLTNDTYENLAKVTKTIQEEVSKNPGIVSMDVDLRLNKPEISLEVDRERAADLGIPVETIARAVETAMGDAASPSTSVKASSTTWWCKPKPRTATHLAMLKKSSCVAEETPWCLCQPWSK
jgi:multidrug efflux pump subunit AcrB